MSLTPSFITNVPVILTRLTEAWSQDLSGNLYRFGVDVPRQTNRGFQIAGAATRQHGEAPTNGSNVVGTSSTLPAEGLFNPVRSISSGATFHRRETELFAVTNAPVYIRIRVRAGTSGKIRIGLRYAISGTESRVSGTFAAPTVAATGAGTITDFVNRLLPNNDREFTFTFLPNVADENVGLSVGPDSAVTGEYIDIIGMQIASSFTDWIMGGAGTKAIAADIMSLDLTGLDMSAGFILKLEGFLDATERENFDRFYQAGSNSNRLISFINPSNGFTQCQQSSGDVLQGNSTLRNSALIPPVAFSLVGAHGIDYIGGAVNGVVASPVAVATYVTPSVLNIGSGGSVNFLPLTLNEVQLVTGAPTTPKVTELAG